MTIPTRVLKVVLPLLLKMTFLILTRHGMVTFIRHQGNPSMIKTFKLLRPLTSNLGLVLGRPVSPDDTGFSLFEVTPIAAFVLDLITQTIMPFSCNVMLSSSGVKLLCLFTVSSLNICKVVVTN